MGAGDPAECEGANFGDAGQNHHECVERTDVVYNVGQECWHACNSQAGNCDFCGSNGACCRKDWPGDPTICQNAIFDESASGHHCVVPRQVDHAGQDCWPACNGQTGKCDFCGSDGA